MMTQAITVETMKKSSISFTLNGDEVAAEVRPGWTLLRTLREVFELTGAKEGCGVGECGSCLVLKDGQAINACLVPAFALADAEIVTIEGLRSLKSFAELRRSLPVGEMEGCGFCTSGFVVALAGLLLANPQATEAEVRDALSGVLCACGNYPAVVDRALSRLSRRRRYGRKRD